MMVFAAVPVIAIILEPVQKAQSLRLNIANSFYAH
jgi:hypothetical protein